MPLTAREIREQFLSFFESKQHRRVASAPLIPEADPTLMFVNAGMVPFKRVFLGEEVREYRRATSAQKVMRVSGKHNDLENVGRTPRHHTFFEMLGNFSFGDYFKAEAIEFAWELMTDRFGFDPEQLVVSVFREDDEAFGLWRDAIGLPESRIYRLDEDENFWSMGETGPCGPCSEIHIDRGPRDGFPDDDPSSESGRFVELWNLVFMQFDRDEAGVMTPLPKPCVDTGAGLERLAAALQGVDSNYDTDLFAPILARAQEVSGVTLGEDAEKDVSLRVVADHARALAFLVGDGVLPSNEGRGYVLRRILRRASRHGILLGVERPFLFEVADAVVDEMRDVYPELEDRRAFITDRVRRDEERFLETLSRGLELLEDEIAKVEAAGGEELSGDSVFQLYDTYGFPVDLTQDILQGRGLRADIDGFEASMQQQRVRARKAWKGSGQTAALEIYGRLAADLSCVFDGYEVAECESTLEAILRGGEAVESAVEGDEVELVTPCTVLYAESGGQVGDRGRISCPGGEVEIEDTQRPVAGLIVQCGRVVKGEIRVGDPVRITLDAETRQATVRNHTGTHLLHAALRQVLGPQAVQKGSLVGPDRLRFDFTHDSALSAAELAEIEDLANGWIEENLAGLVRVMPYREAIESGAVAIFEEKYGDEVRVLSFGDVSTELCGGTHARATGEIGFLKILSESGISSGVRRIEALTGLGAVRHVRRRERLLEEAARFLKAPVEELTGRLEQLVAERRAAKKEIERLQSAAPKAAAGDLLEQARDLPGGGRALAAKLEDVDAKQLRAIVDDLRNRIGSGVVLATAAQDDRVLLAVGVTKDLVAKHRAGDLIGVVAKLVGGGGGGRPDFAQAGGRDASKIDLAIEKFFEEVGAA